MVFHWFDPEEALQVFKNISTKGAIWIMFNFYFAGHETSKQFNRWLVKDYLTTYPSPPRNKSDHVIPRDDPKLALVKEHKGVIKRIKNDGLGVLRYRRLRCQRQARN